MSDNTTNSLPSIDDFDEVAAAEQGVEIELTRADGRPTGIHVTVLGDDAERVKAHVFRTINQRRRQDQVQARKGKAGEVRPIEDDVALTVDKACVIVTGWRGLREEFSGPALGRLLSRNPGFVTQIIEASADAARFTKG